MPFSSFIVVLAAAEEDEDDPTVIVAFVLLVVLRPATGYDKLVVDLLEILVLRFYDGSIGWKMMMIHWIKWIHSIEFKSIGRSVVGVRSAGCAHTRRPSQKFITFPSVASRSHSIISYSFKTPTHHRI